MTTAPTADGRPLLAQAVERCCAAEGSAPITREDAEVVARLLKAVADPVRLPILGVDGTLGNNQAGTPAAGHVFAKTGTRAAFTSESAG